MRFSIAKLVRFLTIENSWLPAVVSGWLIAFFSLMFHFQFYLWLSNPVQNYELLFGTVFVSGLHSPIGAVAGFPFGLWQQNLVDTGTLKPKLALQLDAGIVFTSILSSWYFQSVADTSPLLGAVVGLALVTVVLGAFTIKDVYKP